MESALGAILRRPAKERGLRPINQPGVFDPEIAGMTSFRVPDNVALRVSDGRLEVRTGLGVEEVS